MGDYRSVDEPESIGPATSVFDQAGTDSPPVRYTGGRRYMVLSDFHFDEQEGNISDTLERIGEHQDEYEADAVLLAGDHAAYDSEIDSIIDEGYEIAHIVEGNHDRPDTDAGEGEDLDWRYTGDGGDACLLHDEDTIRWEEVLETGPMSFLMGHEPDRVASRAKYTEEKHPMEFEDADPGQVRIYGHSHMPYDREIDGEVHIGAGSLFHNYSVDYDQMAERSFHLLDVSDAGLAVTHVDFDTGQLMEATFYAFDGEDFVEAASVHSWDAEDRHTDRWE